MKPSLRPSSPPGRLPSTNICYVCHEEDYQEKGIDVVLDGERKHICGRKKCLNSYKSDLEMIDSGGD